MVSRFPCFSHWVQLTLFVRPLHPRRFIRRNNLLRWIDVLCLCARITSAICLFVFRKFAGVSGVKMFLQSWSIFSCVWHMASRGHVSRVLKKSTLGNTLKYRFHFGICRCKRKKMLLFCLLCIFNFFSIHFLHCCFLSFVVSITRLEKKNNRWINSSIVDKLFQNMKTSLSSTVLISQSNLQLYLDDKIV